jgi:hypothetical protein
MKVILKLTVVIVVVGLLVSPAFAGKSECSVSGAEKSTKSSGNIVTDSVDVVGKTVQATGETAVGTVDATGRALTGQPPRTKTQQDK